MINDLNGLPSKRKRIKKVNDDFQYEDDMVENFYPTAKCAKLKTVETLTSPPSKVLQCFEHDSIKDHIVQTNEYYNYNFQTETTSTSTILSTGFQYVENNAELVELAIIERYQLAFYNPDDDLLFIPKCVEVISADYTMTCFAASVVSLETVSADPYLSKMPILLQEEQLQTFFETLEKCFAKLIKTTETRNKKMGLMVSQTPHNLSSPKMKKRRRLNYKCNLEAYLKDWNHCDYEMGVLRRLSFDFITKIFPHIDVTVTFDCNTIHLDQLIDSITQILTQDKEKKQVQKDPSPPSQFILPSVCLFKEPLNQLASFREKMLKLIMILFPDFKLPEGFNIERDLGNLLGVIKRKRQTIKPDAS